jgi:hypothetical protein
MPYTVTESLCFALDDDNILIAGGENMDIGLPTPKTFIFCISKATLTQRTGGEREGVGRSRRQFLTAAATAAGMLALPAMVRASEHSGTIDQDDWTHNTDCDRGFWLGQVTGGSWPTAAC